MNTKFRLDMLALDHMHNMHTHTPNKYRSPDGVGTILCAHIRCTLNTRTHNTLTQISVTKTHYLPRQTVTRSCGKRTFSAHDRIIKNVPCSPSATFWSTHRAHKSPHCARTNRLHYSAMRTTGSDIVFRRISCSWREHQIMYSNQRT